MPIPRDLYKHKFEVPKKQLAEIGKLLFIVAGLVAVSGLLFGVSPLAVKLALSHGGSTPGFPLANLFGIQLTVLRHNITSGTVCAGGGGIMCCLII